MSQFISFKNMFVGSWVWTDLWWSCGGKILNPKSSTELSLENV